MLNKCHICHIIPGTMSHRTDGHGPWYCTEHFKDPNAKVDLEEWKRKRVSLSQLHDMSYEHFSPDQILDLFYPDRKKRKNYVMMEWIKGIKERHEQKRSG